MILYKSLFWLPSFFFSRRLGARLLRAGKLVALLFLSAYESSVFEPGTSGQLGARIWKIFGLGMLGTVKRRGLLAGSEEECSESGGSVWEEYGGTLMDVGVAWGVPEFSRGRKSRLLEVVGSGMVRVERLLLWS